MGQYTKQDPIGLAAGNPTLYGYVTNTLVHIDPLGLIDLNIPDAIGELSIHANPGPSAVPPGHGIRVEHSPAHIHMGGNGGPRVSTRNFQPFSPEDAQRMSPRQRQFVKNLSNQQKNLIRRRSRSVFRRGSYGNCNR